MRWLALLLPVACRPTPSAVVDTDPPTLPADSDSDSDVDSDTGPDGPGEPDPAARCAAFVAATPKVVTLEVREGFPSGAPDVEIAHGGHAAILYGHRVEGALATWVYGREAPFTYGLGLLVRTGGLAAEAGGWSALIDAPDGGTRFYRAGLDGAFTGAELIVNYEGAEPSTFASDGSGEWAALLRHKGDDDHLWLVESGGAPALVGPASGQPGSAAVAIADGVHAMWWADEPMQSVLRYRAPDGTVQDTLVAPASRAEPSLRMDTVDGRPVALFPLGDGLDALTQAADGTFASTRVDTVADPGVSACPLASPAASTPCELDYTQLVPLGVRGDAGLALFAWARVHTVSRFDLECRGPAGSERCDWVPSAPTERDGTAWVGCFDPAWRAVLVSPDLPAVGGSLALRDDTYVLAAYADTGRAFDLRALRVDLP